MAGLPSRTLESGDKLPLLAYGTGTAWFKGQDNQIDRRTVDAIKTAINVGYRHLDGAQMYNTEAELGTAIAECGVPRAELFVTTKSVGVEDVEGALVTSLAKLQTPYVDLYMIHTPFAATSTDQLKAAWHGMERCLQRGLARNIGVSNFALPHLKAILEVASIKPAVNQIEMHPYLQQPELLAFLKENNIALEGFASLTPLVKAAPGPADEICKELADKYSVSPSAVLLRWVIDQGASVVTTSGRQERLAGYLTETPSFQLTPEEVAKISRVSASKRYRGFFTEDFERLEEQKAERL